MHPTDRSRLTALLLAPLALASAANASTTWGGGAAPDTNISNPANWSDGVLPDLTGPSTLSFGVASGTATFDVPVEVVRTSITSAFTFSAGTGSLTYRGTSSGGNAYGIQATSGASNAVIDVPVLVKATTPNSGALGTILLIYNNRVAADTISLRINNGISLAPAPTSSGTGYSIRYGNNGGTADTRIAGSITGLTALQNSSAGGAWAGDLIIAGDQTGLAATAVTISSAASGFQTPTANARLVLGETAADDQTWGNFTLNNVMHLAVGGNITIGSLTTSTTTATKITGTAATLPEAGTLRIASGTVNTVCAIGGTGTNQNNLNIAKNTGGTLTINGTHTYLGTTTVEAGTLVLNGSLASPIAVNAGAVLSGEGSTSGSLTFGAGSSTLAFDPSTQTSALTVASVSLAGATVLVSPTAALTPGTAYTVLKLSSGTFSGSPSDHFMLASRSGALSYTNSGTELTLTAGAEAAATLVWTGSNPTNPTFWDVATTVNWTNSGSPDRYFAGDNVIFDDTAASTTVAIQPASIAPSSLSFNNATKNYSLTGGPITGNASLTKSGAGTVSLGTTGTSTFGGGVVLNEGILEFTSLAQLGGTSVPAALNGGILRFTGTATNTGNLPLSIGASGINIDMASTPSVTVRIGGKVTGSGNILKSGPAILSLGAGNDGDPLSDFTGTLTVTAGILDIRNPLSLGSTAGGTSIQNATLLIQNFGQIAGTKAFAAEPLSFSGNAFLIAYCQENKLFINQLQGPVTVADNTVLGLSTARNSSGSLSPYLELTGSGITTGAGSQLQFGLRPSVLPSGMLEDLQTVTVTGPITGPASVTTQGTALALYTLTAPAYSGDTSVLGGILSLGASNPNNDASTFTIADTNARVELAFSGSEKVARLFIGTTQLAAGTYGATGSGATNIDDTRFVGSGVLEVTQNPVVDLYAAWATSYALTGDAAGKQADPDGDGLENLFEYATGSSPILAGAANVTLGTSGSFLTLTYTRVADPNIAYSVEGASDLAGPWLEVDDVLGANPALGSSADPVTVIDTVVLAPGSKRFLRLRVTE